MWIPNNRELYKQSMTSCTLVYFVTSKSYHLKYYKKFYTIRSTDIY